MWLSLPFLCNFQAWAFGHCRCGSGRAGSWPCAGDGPTVPRFIPLPRNPAQKMHSLPSVFLLFQLCHPKLDGACSHLLHLVVCGITPTQLCAALGEQQASFLFSFERVFLPCTGKLRLAGASRSKLDKLFPAMSGGLSVPVQSRCGGRAASLSPCPRCCILGLGALMPWQMCSPVAALNHLALLSFMASFSFCEYILNQGYFY